MSSGAFHYREAESLLRDARDANPATEPTMIALLLQFADRHLKLASVAVAARAAGLVSGGDKPTEWHKALHEQEGRS